MLFEKSKEDLIEFLAGHYVATLATVKWGNMPHAASIYYHVDKEGNIFFLTKGGTQKFSNINKNGNVAMVITDAESLQTVQLEGFAKEVDYAKDYAQLTQEFAKKLSKSGHPWAQIPINHLTQGYFVLVKVVPNWIKWIDFKDWKHVVQYEENFQEVPIQGEDKNAPQAS